MASCPRQSGDVAQALSSVVYPMLAADAFERGAQSGKRQARGRDHHQLKTVQTRSGPTATGASPGLRPQPQGQDLADVAEKAFAQGTSYAAFSASGILLIGFLGSFFLKSGRRE